MTGKQSKLAQIRLGKGWTQKVAAKTMRISIATLGNYEIGSRRPSLRGVEKMAKAYSVLAQDIVAALPLERNPKNQKHGRTPMPTKSPRKPAAATDDDADAEVLMCPSQTKRAPSWAIDPGTLAHAVTARIKAHKQKGDEEHEYAARALLACLRVGNIEQIVDALVEHFVALEDYDE